MSWVEEAKKRAVLKALEPIKNGWIIGVGSGSTIAYAVPELARLNKVRNLEVTIIPASIQIEQLSIRHGLRLSTLAESYTVDYMVDGADQVEERTLNAIKGGGGALLREKVLASASRQFAIVVDETKLTKRLGGRTPVPLEVLPYAHRFVQAEVTKMGGRARLREGSGKLGPVITDNGNFILDADFGQIRNPTQLEQRLRKIPGLIETGLFIGMAKVAYVGTRSKETLVLKPKRS